MAHDPAEPRLAPRARAWADLRKRVLSAALLAPLALGCIWLGAAPWAVLMALAAAGLAAEWVQLCGRRALALPGAAVPLAVLVAGAAAVAAPGGLGAGLGLALLMAGAALTWAIARPARLAAGILYVGLAGIALIWLRRDADAGRANVLFVVLIVWASDIGAYLAGRLLGGPKLAPRISPGKTWAGAAGGLLAAIAVGLGAASGIGHPAGRGALGQAALVAAALGVIAQAGDLLESGLKRRFGVKDSGRLIPGHGGLLDRLDGLLAAAPAAALLAVTLGQGVRLWE